MFLKKRGTEAPAPRTHLAFGIISSGLQRSPMGLEIWQSGSGGTAHMESQAWHTGWGTQSQSPGPSPSTWKAGGNDGRPPGPSPGTGRVRGYRARDSSARPPGTHPRAWGGERVMLGPRAQSSIWTDPAPLTWPASPES